jgi:hypothetical protein
VDDLGDGFWGAADAELAANALGKPVLGHAEIFALLGDRSREPLGDGVPGKRYP